MTSSKGGRKNVDQEQHGGHTALPKCRTEPMFALGVLHCSYPCCGIYAPREISQGKMITVVLLESADFILLPLNARGLGLIRFSADLTNFVVDEIPTEQ